MLSANRLSVYIVFGMFLFCVHDAAAQACVQPLSLGDVVAQARMGYRSAYIQTQMENRCVSFDLRSEVEKAALHEVNVTSDQISTWAEYIASERLRFVPPLRDDHGLPIRGTSIAIADDWIRTDGTRIFYRYESYLNVPCSERFRAVGNWEGYGWEYRRGPQVQCLGDAWLVFDLGPQVSAGQIVPGLTYCVNITDRRVGTPGAQWGQHGNRGAPGIRPGGEQPLFVVVGPQGERGIGFEVVRDAGGPRIVLSNRHPIALGKC